MSLKPIPSETIYKLFIDRYLNDHVVVEEFIRSFFEQWRRDRDTGQNHDERFARLIDRIFTSCDCYNAEPEGPLEISELDLKTEVQLLTYIWWGDKSSRRK
ncbi:colicin immunity domain-containing protein [Dyadobacter fermentans]|uniref:colicin immunity domain-containing protein n=1 Tax=Dyadobacter fermentans TaxID=94254 RepID=UPI000A02E80D